MTADEYEARLNVLYDEWLAEGVRLAGMVETLKGLRQQEAIEERRALKAAARLGIFVKAA